MLTRKVFSKIINLSYKKFVYSVKPDLADTENLTMKNIKKQVKSKHVDDINLIQIALNEQIDAQKDKPNSQRFFNEFNDIFNEVMQEQPKKQIQFRNVEEAMNKNYQIENFQPTNEFVRRTGVLGYKVGMVGLHDIYGTMHPCTVIHIDRCQVVNVLNPNEKTSIVTVGSGEKGKSQQLRSQLGMFVKNGLPFKKNLKSFKVDPKCVLPVGYMLGVRHFTLGQFVDCTAQSKGKGTQGVMTRWNFAGQPASHGATKSHRKPVNL